jgi:Heterokaryon incompatibility protein (HET)
MSSYRYSPLPDDNIRLLCLLPSASEAEPLQCKLLDYNIQDPSGRTHLYDALSYVWGDQNDTRPIYIVKDKLQGKGELKVTTNLYAALSHLRNFFFQRIIWVDAICIDQKNIGEREQQILLMAKIYSQAICVLVWLEEKTEDIDGALEDIRLAANKELTASSKKEINQQAVLALLERPWFQRIWVREQTLSCSYKIALTELL